MSVSIFLGNLVDPGPWGTKTLYYNEDNNSLCIDRTWAGSVDDAATYSDSEYVDYDYAKRELEMSLSFCPENQKSIDFLESIRDKFV